MFTSVVPRSLDGGDVDLLHRHHRLECTLCLTATSCVPPGTACHEDAAYSIRRARTGSIEAARRAGMMPEMAAASTSTPMAMVMTGTFTVVIS